MSSLTYHGSASNPSILQIVCQSQLGGVITSGGGFSNLYYAPSWQVTFT